MLEQLAICLNHTAYLARALKTFIVRVILSKKMLKKLKIYKFF